MRRMLPGRGWFRTPDGGGPFRLGAVNVLSLRSGPIVEIAVFLAPDVYRYFGLPGSCPTRPRGFRVQVARK